MQEHGNTPPGLSCSLPPRWGCPCFPVSRSTQPADSHYCLAPRGRQFQMLALAWPLGQKWSSQEDRDCLGGEGETGSDFLHTSLGGGALSLWPSPLCTHTGRFLSWDSPQKVSSAKNMPCHQDHTWTADVKIRGHPCPAFPNTEAAERFYF